MEIIDKALKEGRKTLSEYESKQILAAYGIPVTREKLADGPESAVFAARGIGYPVVLKGCAPDVSHKTELDLIRVDVRDEEEVKEAFDEITNHMEGTEKAVLVQEMVRGKRELVMGLTRDVQFGPCVMFGLGGIFTEILKDIAFRVAPLERRDALDMMGEIKGHKILESVRGMAEADRELLAEMLIHLGRVGLENKEIKEIDINPVILKEGKPVAVDALVVLG